MSPEATLQRDAVLSPPSSRSEFYDEVNIELTEEALQVAARLADAGLSDTYVVYEQAGRWSIGLGVLAELTVDHSEVVLTDPAGVRTAVRWTSQPLDVVARLLADLDIVGWRAYGWAAFELSYANAGLPDLVGEDTLLRLVVPHSEVRLESGRATIRSTRPDTLRAIGTLLATPAPAPTYQPQPLDVESVDADDYRSSVAAAVREIQDGRLQKVILSRVVPIDGPLDVVGTYVVGRRSNNPARSFLLSLGGMRAAGFSPEIVVAVEPGGWVTSQPLAGTRELSRVDEDNQRLRRDLLTDAKEIVEHALSVKAAFDELSDVCDPTSVVVNDFMAIKERGSVQHLASSVSGQLRPGLGPWSAFAALFPAVTASGVPKVPAYHCIARHEPHRRGLYSGAVLTVDQNGALDAALVLRTIFERAGTAWLRAGAGIVDQSTPDREFQETCEKLRSVALHLVPAPSLVVGNG